MESAAIAGGIEGYTLMQSAGAAALLALTSRWPNAKRLLFVCGAGNNGGDGLVMARLAAAQGLAVRTLQVDNLGERVRDLPAEAQRALVEFRASGLEVSDFDPALLADADVIVDALLGIGVRAPLGDNTLRAIAAINAIGRPVLALDIPSGLDPDRGIALPAVKAAATITFIAVKQGLWLADGPEHCGTLIFDSLSVSSSAAETPSLVRTDASHIAKVLPPRSRNSHKGQFGRVLVIGGGAGMAGAARLAGEAALRVGAGLVTVASLAEHQALIVGPRPELMFRAVNDARVVAESMANADVIAVGPGLGRDAWAKAVLLAVFDAQQPHQQLILDADALNLVAEGVGRQHDDHWVLTPHPGEAARLLQIDAATVQGDRLSALQRLCVERGGTIVLKGAGTLIGNGQAVPQLCAAGNSGMAVPGMGDVLTGCIAGVLAQCRQSPDAGATIEALAAAVHLHAMAGDRCAANGIRGILAIEVAEALRTELAPYP
jgi:ADP-dependent NAD(P)H-hydrate dehydratase / NAD(P)H-hydrate epimerase